MAPDLDSEGAASSNWALVAAAWMLVAAPLLWGIWSTLVKAAVLFR